MSTSGKATTVKVGPSGKKVYDYPEVGPEAKGNGRLRDKRRRNLKAKQKENAMSTAKGFVPVQKEQIMVKSFGRNQPLVNPVRCGESNIYKGWVLGDGGEDDWREVTAEALSPEQALEKSGSEYADLFRGGVTPDSTDGEMGYHPGQFEPAQGRAGGGLVAPHRPNSTGTGMQTPPTLPGVYGAKAKKKDKADPDSETQEENAHLTKGFHPYTEGKIHVIFDDVAQDVICPVQYGDTPLFRGWVRTRDGRTVEQQFEVDLATLSKSTSAPTPEAEGETEAGEVLSVPLESLSPSMATMYKSMGYEEKEGKDGKKKLEKRVGNWAGPNKSTSSCSDDEDKTKDKAKNLAKSYGEDLRRSLNNSAPAWTPGGTDAPAPYSPLSVKEQSAANASWAAYDAQKQQLLQRGQDPFNY